MTARSLVAAPLVICLGVSGSAYLKYGTTVDGRSVVLRWERPPVRYFVTDRGVPGVSAAEFGASLGRAFRAWQDVPTATVTFEQAGFTGLEPFQPDGLSVLGFQDQPGMDRTLGATNYTVNERTGEILEADIFFNALFAWSVAPGGEAGHFDVDSIAVHEVGHLLGLGHSALGETEQSAGGRRVIAAASVMFPIAFSRGTVIGRSLFADDVAGVSDIYPSSEFERRSGQVTGRVVKNGRGVLGAHVTAFNLRTATLVSNFSLSHDGMFTIAGLDPGPTVLRVEPLDDGDLESFISPAGDVDVNFKVTFARQVANVPAGGAAGPFTIEVEPK